MTEEEPTAEVLAEEPQYKDGDPVWVKIGNCWWPGEVHDVKRVPPEIIQDFKKQPIAIVKFFNEDSYEYVFNNDLIFHYNCERKHEFLQKGLLKNRKKPKFMEKFSSDVEKVETMIGGDPNILKSEEFRPAPKIDYRSLFSAPTPNKDPNKSVTPKAFRRKSSTHTISVEDFTRRMHINFNYDVHYLSSNKTVDKVAEKPLNAYTCNRCNFKCSRLNVFVYHHKTHTNPLFNGGKKPRKPRKPHKFKMTRCETSTIEEDLALIAQGIDICTYKKPVEQKKKDVKITNLLADWEDDEDEGKTKEKSCFDFEEDEVVAPVLTPGRKIPRVIPEKEDTNRDFDKEFDQIMQETALPELLVGTSKSGELENIDPSIFVDDNLKKKGKRGNVETQPGKRGRPSKKSIGVEKEDGQSKKEENEEPVKKGRRSRKVEIEEPSPEYEVIEPSVEEVVTKPIKKGRRSKKEIEEPSPAFEPLESVEGETVIEPTKKGRKSKVDVIEVATIPESEVETTKKVSEEVLTEKEETTKKTRKGKKEIEDKIEAALEVLETTGSVELHDKKESETLEVSGTTKKTRRSQISALETTENIELVVPEVVEEVVIEATKKSRRGKKVEEVQEIIPEIENEPHVTQEVEVEIKKSRRGKKDEEFLDTSIGSRTRRGKTEEILTDDSEIASEPMSRNRRSKKEELLETLEDSTVVEPKKNRRGKKDTIEVTEEIVTEVVEATSESTDVPRTSRRGKKEIIEQPQEVVEITETAESSNIENVEVIVKTGRRSKKFAEVIDPQDGTMEKMDVKNVENLETPRTTRRGKKEILEVTQPVESNEPMNAENVVIDNVEVPIENAELSVPEPSKRGRRGKKEILEGTESVDVPKESENVELPKGNRRGKKEIVDVMDHIEVPLETVVLENVELPRSSRRGRTPHLEVIVDNKEIIETVELPRSSRRGRTPNLEVFVDNKEVESVELPRSSRRGKTPVMEDKAQNKESEIVKVPRTNRRGRTPHEEEVIENKESEVPEPMKTNRRGKKEVVDNLEVPVQIEEVVETPRSTRRGKKDIPDPVEVAIKDNENVETPRGNRRGKKDVSEVTHIETVPVEEKEVETLEVPKKRGKKEVTEVTENVVTEAETVDVPRLSRRGKKSVSEVVENVEIPAETIEILETPRTNRRGKKEVTQDIALPIETQEIEEVETPKVSRRGKKDVLEIQDQAQDENVQVLKTSRRGKKDVVEHVETTVETPDVSITEVTRKGRRSKKETAEDIQNEEEVETDEVVEVAKPNLRGKKEIVEVIDQGDTVTETHEVVTEIVETTTKGRRGKKECPEVVQHEPETSKKNLRGKKEVFEVTPVEETIETKELVENIETSKKVRRGKKDVENLESIEIIAETVLEKVELPKRTRRSSKKDVTELFEPEEVPIEKVEAPKKSRRGKKDVAPEVTLDDVTNQPEELSTVESVEEKLKKINLRGKKDVPEVEVPIAIEMITEENTEEKLQRTSRRSKKDVEITDNVEVPPESSNLENVEEKLHKTSRRNKKDITDNIEVPIETESSKVEITEEKLQRTTRRGRKEITEISDNVELPASSETIVEEKVSKTNRRGKKDTEISDNLEETVASESTTIENVEEKLPKITRRGKKDVLDIKDNVEQPVVSEPTNIEHSDEKLPKINRRGKKGLTEITPLEEPIPTEPTIVETVETPKKTRRGKKETLEKEHIEQPIETAENIEIVETSKSNRRGKKEVITEELIHSEELSKPEITELPKEVFEVTEPEELPTEIKDSPKKNRRNKKEVIEITEIEEIPPEAEILDLQPSSVEVSPVVHSKRTRRNKKDDENLFEITEEKITEPEELPEPRPRTRRSTKELTEEISQVVLEDTSIEPERKPPKKDTKTQSNLEVVEETKSRRRKSNKLSESSTEESTSNKRSTRSSDRFQSPKKSVDTDNSTDLKETSVQPEVPENVDSESKSSTETKRGKKETEEEEIKPRGRKKFRYLSSDDSEPDKKDSSKRKTDEIDEAKKRKKLDLDPKKKDQKKHDTKKRSKSETDEEEVTKKSKKEEPSTSAEPTKKRLGLFGAVTVTSGDKELPKYLQKPPPKPVKPEPPKVDTPTRLVPYEGAFAQHFAELDAVITQIGRKGRKKGDQPGIITTKQPKADKDAPSIYEKIAATTKIRKEIPKKVEPKKEDIHAGFTKIDKFKRNLINQKLEEDKNLKKQENSTSDVAKLSSLDTLCEVAVSSETLKIETKEEDRKRKLEEVPASVSEIEVSNEKKIKIIEETIIEAPTSEPVMTEEVVNESFIETQPLVETQLPVETEPVIETEPLVENIPVVVNQPLESKEEVCVENQSEQPPEVEKQPIFEPPCVEKVNEDNYSFGEDTSFNSTPKFEFLHKKTKKYRQEFIEADIAKDFQELETNDDNLDTAQLESTISIEPIVGTNEEMFEKPVDAEVEKRSDIEKTPIQTNETEQPLIISPEIEKPLTEVESSSTVFEKESMEIEKPFETQVEIQPQPDLMEIPIEKPIQKPVEKSKSDKALEAALQIAMDFELDTEEITEIQPRVDYEIPPTQPESNTLSSFKIEDIPLPPTSTQKSPIKFEKFKIKTPASKKIVTPKGFNTDDDDESLIRKGHYRVIENLKKTDKECESPKKRVMADYQKEIDLEKLKKLNESKKDEISNEDLEETIPVKPILKTGYTIESEMAKLTDTKPEEGEILPDQTYSTTSSKLLEILESKTDRKIEKKLIPVTANFSGLTAAQKKTVQSKLVLKSSPLIKKSKPIILSEEIITPANETKRNFEDDIEEQKGGIKKFIIEKADLKPKSTEVKEDDNIFDINSMPIVLSDDLLTPESIENMPIVISNEPKMKMVSKQKTIIHPALNKSQKIYSAASKLPNKTTVITQQGKSEKFIILPSTTTATGSKYTVGKRLVQKQVIQKPITKPGNKVMVVTNAQGQQSRIILSPAQQKLLGTKIVTRPTNNLTTTTKITQPITKTLVTTPKLLSPKTPFKTITKKVTNTPVGIKTKTMIIKGASPSGVPSPRPIAPPKIQPSTSQVVPVKRQVIRQKLPEKKVVPPLVPLTPKETPEESPKQLIIQDDMGNQTSITQGQILAVPGGEVVDGQPQSYMLVTVDESGNLLPLDNQALMALDPSLIGPDGNVTLTLNNPEEEKPQPVIQPNLDLLMEEPKPEQPVTYSISNAEDGQQILISGDPEKAQHLINALASGNQDITKLMSDGNIIVNADGQHIILNSDEQLIVDNFNYNQSTKDILAAALANTVFPQETPETTTEINPYQNMPNLTSGAVMETSLTNLAPIMSPLELPTGQLPKKTDAKVTTNNLLPITITDPNISQIGGYTIPESSPPISMPLLTEDEPKNALEVLATTANNTELEDIFAEKKDNELPADVFAQNTFAQQKDCELGRFVLESPNELDANSDEISIQPSIEGSVDRENNEKKFDTS